MKNDSEPGMYSPVGEKLVSETSFGSSNCEKVSVRLIPVSSYILFLSC